MPVERRISHIRLSCRVIGVLILGLISATGCDVSNMAFVQDERLRVIAPEDRGMVSLPVTLRWEFRGGTDESGIAVEMAEQFAVFVDRPPIPPRKSLEWFAHQSDSCGQSACGSVDNVSDVYTTKKTSVVLTRLPALPEGRDIERHEAVIILLDRNGVRISESAFYVRFNFKREA